MPDPTTTGTSVSSSAASTGVGIPVATESSLSNWAGPYVTEMLGRGQALASTPYQAYEGPLTAGGSTLQSKAFEGLAGLTIPTSSMGAFTPKSFTDTGVSQNYMNPYLEQALAPQLAEARRQSEIENLQNRAALTKAGAYGGGRQAIMESENQRNLLTNLAGITGKGYETAYNKGMEQFNTEQKQGLDAQTAANTYGLAALQKQADLGATQRGITSEGIEADKKQFEEERDYPYKQVQYMQSLLQSLPLATQNYSYTQPSALSQALSQSGGVLDLYDRLFGKTTSTSSGTTGTTTGTTTKP